MEELILLGANHRVAPIEIRDRLAISKAELPLALSQLSQSPHIQEVFLLSTCNRSEVYLYGREEALEDIERFWEGWCSTSWEELRPCLYQKLNGEAVFHLFSVGAGIDSMVLGETQILGQIRESFAASQQTGTIGPRLDALLRKTLETARRARRETGLGSKAASISQAAVELAFTANRRIAQALILGAGEVAKLTAQAFRAQGVGHLYFSNRTLSRARDLARSLGGTAVPFGEFPSRLVDVDLVVSCTDAPHYILTHEAMARAVAQRRARSMVILDLAVPRDVDPQVAWLDGVQLFNVDHLAEIVGRTYQDRAPQIERAREILRSEAERFMARQRSREAAPLISALRQRAEAIRQGELQRMDGKLRHLPLEQVEAIDILTRSIVNKLLHNPTQALKEAASQDSQSEYLRAVARLFGLQ